MADEPTTEETVALPPKQSPLKPVTLAPPPGGAAAPAASDAPKTIVFRKPQLRRPGEAPATPPVSPLSPKAVTLKPPVSGASAVRDLSKTEMIAKGIAISRSDAAKKVTSRINVSSATAPIPPVAEAPAATPFSKVVTPAAPAAPVNEKKVTSRITLESAFAGQPDAMPDAQPKTIKLKRPGSPLTPIAPIAPAAPAAPQGLPEGMTPIAPLDGAAGEEPMTRRKTIKVKRPGASAMPGAPRLNLGQQSDGIASPEDNLQALSNFSAGAKHASAPDKVNPIFLVAAVAAMLIGSILIWVLVSQTYGERGAAGDYARPAGPQIAPPPWLHPID